MTWSKTYKLTAFLFLTFFVSVFFPDNDPASLKRNIAACFNPPTGTTLKKDSLKKAINRHANRASLMSAIVPGLGQIYNHKYWKPPIIYAALGGLGYFAFGFNGTYQKYHNELLFRYAHANTGQINSFPEYTNDNLITLKNQSKKYRDLCFIGMGIFYVLNIVDANVDGHLRDFDVSDNLSMKISPRTFYIGQSNSNFGVGISLALHIK